jgi:hypothetical protein
MSTYRERRERRAEQLREWAEQREAKSSAAHQASHDATAGIPFGQPILVGHHSQRRHERAIERAQNQATAAVEHGRKAEEMAGRADEIERHAAGAIYSDDADAVERLREKLERLEAERDRIKRYNASCRKAAKTGGNGDLSILTEAEQRDLLSTAKACPYMIGPGLSMPSYKLQNLGGNITRARDRLKRLERERERGPADRYIAARFASECETCGAELAKGSTIRYNRQEGARCVTCPPAASENTP